MTQLKRAYVNGKSGHTGLPEITTRIRDHQVSHDIFVSVNNRVEYAVAKEVKVISNQVWLHVIKNISGLEYRLRTN